MKAQILNVSYSVFKEIAQKNGFQVYFYEDEVSTEQGSAYIGNPEYVYTTRIVSDTWDDFDDTFPNTSRHTVGRRDDAFALIVGTIVKPPTPREVDGRMNVVQAPMSQGNSLYITGRSDCWVADKRGSGPKIGIRFAEGGYSKAVTWVDDANHKFGIAGDQTSDFHEMCEHILIEGSTDLDNEYTIKEVTYNSTDSRTEIEVYWMDGQDLPGSTVDGNLRWGRIKQSAVMLIDSVELSDGQLTWEPDEWDGEDEFTFSIHIAATAVTPNGSNEGNCNLDTQTGLITPAANDGAFDVDLSSAIALPGSALVSYGIPGGYWDYAGQDMWSNDPLVPAINGPTTGGVHLIAGAVDSPRFMKSIPMSHPMGVFDIDVPKTEYIYKAYMLELMIKRVSAGAAKAFGWLQFYRRDTT